MSEPSGRRATGVTGLTTGRLALLRGLRNGAAADRAEATPLLVAIKPEGGRPPLFLPPPVSGSAYWYPPLVRLLHPDQPVYGFESPGLHGTGTPRGSIVETAADYLEALRLHRPHGPYLLAGYSMGGTVAFELAGQLAVRGEEVAMLVLIDSTAPNPSPPADEEATLRRFVSDVAGAVRRDPSSVDLAPAVAAADDDGRVRGLAAALHAAGLLPDGVDEAFVRRRFTVFRTNMRALQAYDPAPYPGRLVAVRAAESTDSGTAWRPFATGGVDEVVVPGDHYSMWSPAHLPDLARALDRELTAAVVGR